MINNHKDYYNCQGQFNAKKPHFIHALSLFIIRGEVLTKPFNHFVFLYFTAQNNKPKNNNNTKTKD